MWRFGEFPAFKPKVQKLMQVERDFRVRFNARKRQTIRKQPSRTLLTEHNYAYVYLCDGDACKNPNFTYGQVKNKAWP
jgi:hypothetical protein